MKTLSPEALEVARDMISYCIANGIGMGMNEGFVERKDKHGSPVKVPKMEYRKELEAFSGYPQ